MSALATTALLSGLFAAAVAIAVTRAIELLGGTLGGVLATLPTTMVPASVGFAQLALRSLQVAERHVNPGTVENVVVDGEHQRALVEPQRAVDVAKLAGHYRLMHDRVDV